MWMMGPPVTASGRLPCDLSIVLLCSMILDLCVCWDGTGWWWVSVVEEGGVSASTIGPYSSWNPVPESFAVRVRMRGLQLRRV